jgi:hypothetical protein
MTNDPINATIQLRETIIIGVGSAGRAVLSQIVSNLNRKFEKSWRSTVHVVQVDADIRKTQRRDDWQSPLGLLDNEWVLLFPDLEEVVERIQKSPHKWDYLRWYDKTSPAYARSKGRLALFYDLKDGPRYSKFWTAIENAYRGLSKPVVRIVGTTFDDVGSGILADIAYLVKRGIMQRDADVELWLLGPNGEEEWDEFHNSSRISIREQYTRTLATLRELERFQRNAKTEFVYVSPQSKYTQLNQSYQYAITPTIFLFDPKAKQQTSKAAMKEMANAISTLLYPEVDAALAKHLSANRVDAAGKSVVCGIGQYEFRLSSDLFEEAMAWRIVKDVLFEEKLGVFPLERSLDDGRYEALGSFVPVGFDFLKEQETISKWVNYSIEEGDTHLLVRNISARLGQILNGEFNLGSSNLKDRRLSIERAERWLKVFISTLRMYPELDSFHRVGALSDQIQILKDWMEEDVKNLCDKRLGAARENLRKTLSASEEPSQDAHPEWEEYKSLFLSNDYETQNYSQKPPLEQVASRFGWFVSYDEQGQKWEIQLVIPPLDFGWQKGSNPSYYAVRIDESDFLVDLHKIASAFIQLGRERTAVEQALGLDFKSWPDSASVMLNYNESEASDLTGGIQHLTLLGASVSLARTATENFVTQLDDKYQLPITVCDTQDPRVVQVMRVVDWVPFETLGLYKQEGWDVSAVLPSHYVWEEEQWAAEIEENSSEKFSPTFLSNYSQHKEFITAFGYGLLYGLFVYDGTGNWYVPGLDAQVRLGGNAELYSQLWKVLNEMNNMSVSSLVDAWMENIEATRDEIKADTYSYFREFEKNQLVEFIQHPDRRERDFGVFLRYLIGIEKKKLRSA